MFTEKKYTQPHREAILQIIESQFSQIVQGIAAGRDLEVEAVRTLVDRGPFLGAQALAENLVDGLAYRDEVRALIDADLGEEAEMVGLFPYLPPDGGGPTTKGRPLRSFMVSVGCIAARANTALP